MDFDQRLENRSYATARTFLAEDRDGFDVCVTVAKIAFRVSAQGEVRLGYRPVRGGHTWDDGTLRFPADNDPEKPGTDVGLVGTAHPLPRRDGPKNSGFASLQVGKLRKVIQLFGPRHYRADLSISEAGPLTPIPLRYDRAFGGRDPNDDTPCDENPIGVGYHKNKLSIGAMTGKPAPQLEPVNDMLDNAPRAHASHATFGPIPEQWKYRRAKAGTYDETWRRERHPVLPLDFDPCYYNWSTPALWSKEPLLGDEPVEVAGVLPEGVWRFKLPLYPMRFEVDLDDTTLGPPTHLDSFLIDADERVVELTYRATTRFPLKWDRLRAIRAIGTVKLSRDLLVADEWPRAS